MQIEQLLKKARKLWGSQPMSVDHMAICLGVVQGDICRQARTLKEGGNADEQEIKKELGNVIFSAIRWCDDMGYDPEECIELAIAAQSDYVQRRR